MIVHGPKIHEAFRESVANNNTSRCHKQLEALLKKKTIQLDAIGSRPNNLLLDFLKCQTKVLRSNSSTNNCKALEKSYASCHASVMGTGNFNGNKHCGDQLQEWLECVRLGSTSGMLGEEE